MILEGSFLVGIVAIGKLLDRYSTDAAKAKIGHSIELARSLDWHNFVAQRSWLIYCKIFGSHGASLRFFVRSFAAYTLLCLVSFIFLFMFFRTTFTAATSVWQFGEISEQIIWLACLVSGGLLYVLANAQTLYFLEILKTAPNFFKFFLVAYADFLITASITLFGVPVLLTANTFGAINTGHTSLSIEVDFTQLDHDPLDALAGDAAVDQTALRQVAEQRRGAYVRFRFIDSAIGLTAAQADFEAVLREARAGRLRVEMNPNGQGLAIRGNDGQVVRYVTEPQPYEGRVQDYFGDGRNRTEAHANFCQRFARGPRNISAAHTTFSRPPAVARALHQACLNKSRLAITLPVGINSSNIEWGVIYKRALFVTLNDLLASMLTGFGTYLVESPYRAFANDILSQPIDIWRNNWTSDDYMKGGGKHFDEMLYNAYLEYHGTNNIVAGRGFAAGSVIFAIMSTAAINIIVMAVFFVLFPVVKVIEKQDAIKKYVAFETSPFTIISIVVAILAGLVMGVIGIF
jgi:hypothetical protein